MLKSDKTLYIKSVYLIIGIVTLLLLSGCVVEEWGIIIENGTNYEISGIRISEDKESWYQIKLSSVLRPGAISTYYWVDYGEYKYCEIVGKKENGESIKMVIDLSSAILEVGFPEKGRLRIRINDNE